MKREKKGRQVRRKETEAEEKQGNKERDVERSGVWTELREGSEACGWEGLESLGREGGRVRGA